jgi:hypothetical protein
MKMEIIDSPDMRIPAPPELIDRAKEMFRKHPECFWFWRTDANIKTLHDIWLTIKNLRDYGDRSAWYEAQELVECLSPLSKKMS